jgi:hypothetical protein
MGVMQEFMEQTSATREPVGLNKPALRAAIDAAQAWYGPAKISFNTALPEPAKTVLTANQKARIMFLIAKEDFDGDG